MPDGARKRELGRGERVLPGLWRLRLPLPWVGVPHANAWALAAGPGVVLVDCGADTPGGLDQLERALDQVGLSLGHVRLLVCTHAHSDHYGLAATVVERTGCELWMHPSIDHIAGGLDDPQAALTARLEIARHSGVPAETVRRFADAHRDWRIPVAGLVRPDRPLGDGDEIETDHGRWQVIETPGHAPSHICLVQPERRLLISGDHLLGRVSPFFDVGYTPDPTGEFLRSLDPIEAAGARLCLAGHGKPFTDVQAHIDATRALVLERLEAVVAALRDGPATAYELIPVVHGRPAPDVAMTWWLGETIAYLIHLEATGRVRRLNGEPERWAAA